MKEAHPGPDVVLLPIDDSLMRLCKEQYRRTDKIVYQQRDWGDPQTAIAPLFDFHNYLKAQAALRGFVTQMITPKTIVFSEEKQSPALIGWNFSVAVYYKATGVPWKLAEIDDDTCYIGVSFYRETRFMRASIAQVYMRTGESQVIRGGPFEWDEEHRGRNVRLDSSQMAKIIRDSVDVFYRQRGQLPRRIVVHKSTRFSEDEIAGCDQACNRVDELDIVHIPYWSGFRDHQHQVHFISCARNWILQSNPSALT